MSRRFVPEIASDLGGLSQLVDLFTSGPVAVLTGAGCSTASGIPDYRGPEAQGKKQEPITYQRFTRDALARRRYWSRSAIGWPRIQQALPNEAHQALARLEQRGHLTGLITQNVDGLHGAAGSQYLVDLHGKLARVICLDCRALSSRDEIQRWLARHNPEWMEQQGSLAPDGDVQIIDDPPQEFQIPHCYRCGGMLKPDVVFFGENVAKPVVRRAWNMVDEAQALLVVGSSLTVYSGYRFVRGAEQRNLPVAIINLGPTRGDRHAQIQIQARAGQALKALDQRLAEGQR